MKYKYLADKYIRNIRFVKWYDCCQFQSEKKRAQIRHFDNE